MNRKMQRRHAELLLLLKLNEPQKSIVHLKYNEFLLYLEFFFKPTQLLSTFLHAI